MAIEYINTTDSLNTGRVKINKAIDGANNAELKSASAEVNSIEAKTIANQVKTQLNGIVLENGNSNPEIVAMRTDKEGRTFDTAGDRLDNVDEQLVESARSVQQNPLAKVSQDMANGIAVNIDCFGDSTYYGLISGGSGQVATPAPAMLQDTLRAYFGNNEITVNNRGVSGDQTTNALRTFETKIISSSAQVIYINYGLNDLTGANPSGVNDPAISAEQYKENLRSLVSIARRYGKVVVLETPNVELANHQNANFQFRMEGAQQFSNVMKQVANEMNVPLVDQQYLTKKYLAGRTNIVDAFPDGIHPSQELYKQKGLNMAFPFLNLTRIVSPMVMPSAMPGFRGDSPKRDTDYNVGSRTNLFFYSDTSVRSFIWIDEPGLDVYIATAQWKGGTSQCQIKVDTEPVGVFSLKDSAFSSVYASDNEVLVLENAVPGLHLIELYNPTPSSSDRVGLYYLRTRLTRLKPKQVYAISQNYLPTIVERTTVLQSVDIIGAANSVSGKIMTDIALSRVIKPFEIEVEAEFTSGDGFSVFMKPNSDGSGPQGGLYLWLNTSSGIINMSEGNGPSGFTSAVTFNTTSYAGASHIYKLKISQSGIIDVFVDDIKIGTYTMTKPHYGGFFGFYKNTIGTTRIKRVSIA